MNLSQLFVNLYDQMPQEVSQLIKMLASNPSKWGFSNQIFDIAKIVMKNVPFNIDNIKKFIVPCDVNG